MVTTRGDVGGGRRLPDGTPVIVSGSNDRTVRVWRLTDGTQVGALCSHDDRVTSVVVGALPDGTPVILSGSDDDTVRIWRLADGTPVGSPLNLQSPTTAIAVSGALFVAAMGNDIVAIELNR